NFRLRLFFFSSRRRHTRWPRDWSSDVCSSDLHTIALVCVCFGLRISECLALKWSDVDWLNGRLRIERGIYRQEVDSVKTVYSERSEERRVGKEWRCRMMPCVYKKET